MSNTSFESESFLPTNPSEENEAISYELHPSQGKSAAEVVALLRDPAERQNAIERRRRKLLAQRSLGYHLDIVARYQLED